jgi:hypothetical protein
LLILLRKGNFDAEIILNSQLFFLQNKTVIAPAMNNFFARQRFRKFDRQFFYVFYFDCQNDILAHGFCFVDAAI